MLSLAQQNKWREEYRREHPGWRPATEVYAGLVRQELRPESRLLDVGCGRGGLIEQLDHPLTRTVGIDPDYLSLREHRLARLPRAAALSDRLPFAAESFDIVTASWLLEHLVDPATTFAAISRVLRPGGVLVFITPNARHPLAWLNKFAGRLGRIQGRLVDQIYGRGEGDTFSTHYRANSAKTLSDLASRSSLVLESLELVADPSYMAFNKFLYEAMSAIDARLPAGRRIHIVGMARKTKPASA